MEKIALWDFFPQNDSCVALTAGDLLIVSFFFFFFFLFFFCCRFPVFTSLVSFQLTGNFLFLLYIFFFLKVLDASNPEWILVDNLTKKRDGFVFFYQNKNAWNMD